MAKCETCGNDYAKAFQVTLDGKTHTFDCFECAIEMLAPACAHCGCSIIGHGVEQGGDLFCCAHCARQAPDSPASSTTASASSPPIDEQESVITDPKAQRS